MIRNNDKISPYQLGTMLIMTVISVGVFMLPADVTAQAKSDGWIAVLLAGLVNLGATLVIVALACRYPGKTFAEFSQEILGTIAGKILLSLFTIYAIVILAYELRSFSEVVKMFLLFRTPAEVIILSLIFVSAYIVRSGVEAVARMNELLLPLLFIPFILIMLLGFPDLDFSNLLPVLQQPMDVVKAMPTTLIAFGGIEFILIYLGFMKNPQKAYRPAVIAIVFITIFYIGATIICLASFGTKGTPLLLWPLIGYIRSINVPGLFLERMDGVVLTLWVMTVFTTMLAIYFAASYSLSKIIGTKEQKQYVLPISIIAYYLALQPDNLAQHVKWSGMIFNYAIPFFLYVVPILLLFISYVRKAGVRNDGKA